MKLHYTARSDHRNGLTSLGCAIGAFAVAALFGLILGGPLFMAAAVFLSCVGLLLLAVGIVLVASSLRPIHITIDEPGLDVHGQGMDITLRWSEIDAISVETLPTPPAADPASAPQPPKQVLVLWPHPTVPMPHPPTFRPGLARKGHVLVELHYLEETREQIEAVLRRYGGDRFRSLAAT